MCTLSTGGAPEFTRRLPELLGVYREAFLDEHEADPEAATADRAALMTRHAERPGLLLVTADDPAGALVGFCYGYRGAVGQWWHDVVARALAADERLRWLANCREIVELHVRPGAQGHGLGRRLLRKALHGVPEATVALSALDLPETRARRLYASEGFRPLLTGFRFPGTPTAYVVLVKRLDAPVPSLG